ncbi:MAG: argininosuccinate synthase [Planctomycetota bacterium]
MARTVVLAYSGGLDTSAIVPWLRETKDCEVICYVADVGQGADELAGVEEKAKASGASGCYVDDLREAFVDQVIWPTLKSGALYEGSYPLGTAMARPIIARGQVELARRVGADGLCHGCTGKGNDQVRFEVAFAALAPEMEVIAPWREWDFKGRDDLIAYCRSHGVPVTSTAEKIYSRDRNLWHISHEGGPIEDVASPAPADAWMLTSEITDTPDEPCRVRIEFESGVPVAVDGVRLDGVRLIEQLNGLAGTHGVGRIDIVENRVVGMKSRGLYETPGGTVLYEASRGLEDITLEYRSRKLKQQLALEFAELIYAGKWWIPARAAIQAAVEMLAQDVSGAVTVELFKGSVSAISRTSPNSMYAERIASFDMAEGYDQADAHGFLRLFALPERIRAAATRPADEAGS